jgi:hypothetical protein
MKHTSFILHFRNDCLDRVSSLLAVLGHLESLTPNEIILINDDIVIDPVMRVIKEMYPKVKSFFMENDNGFKKSLGIYHLVTIEFLINKNRKLAAS